ncbi:hypothetical protein F4777DRAFT_330285 [Nemania sp. FL0916]|nr:hypothetical protein F4777DRAFT_330285 [Nemania sp. FL0916]
MGIITLPRGRSSSQKTQAPTCDMPSPLHIIKRTKTVEFRPKLREISNESVDYGPDQPLSVMKKRQRQGPVMVAPNVSAYENQSTKAESTFKFGGKSLADFIPPVQHKAKFQPRLRWFSGRRTSSSGTTCRRHDLRCDSTSSGSSSVERSSNSGLTDELSASELSEPQITGHLDTSFSGRPTPTNYNDDCHLLVPRISVTPEIQWSQGGISEVWAAVEVSIQLCRPYSDSIPNSHPDDSTLLSNPLRQGSVSRFGYIDNLQLDVFPVPQTAIIDVVRGDTNRLNLGSTILMLVKVQINHRQPQQPDRGTNRNSSELIDDIESELGVDVIRLVQVCLRYQHSGFPACHSLAPTYGTVDCQTRLATTAIGVIERQAFTMPVNRSPRGGSSLFGIVASYWGPFRAQQIFCRTTFNPTNSTVTGSHGLLSRPNAMATDYNNNHSLTRTTPFTPIQRNSAGFHQPSPEQGEDPARKIWTEMRRRASRGRPNAANIPAAAATLTSSQKSPINTGSLRIKSDVDRRREQLRDVALSNKRSIGADSLKSLVPSMANLNISSVDEWGNTPPNTFNKENVPPVDRKEGRWTLAGWW